jgi:hyperosmotically inducible protein
MRKTKQVTRLGQWAVAVLLAAAATFGTAACSTNVPVSEQIDDAAITAEVKSKLAADPEVSAHNIDVDTNEGVVTLSGRVDDSSEKSEAEQLARSADGVRRVINNLRVGDKT